MIRIALTTAFLLLSMTIAFAADFDLELRYQQPRGEAFDRATKHERWPAAKTAIIVCDVWDYHHCLNAVRRLEEFGPRMNEVLKKARAQGATIIHSPSDCMPQYADHPARQRAIELPDDEKPPRDITHWCSQIKGEMTAAYPIDQSDGGEDDDPKEHAAWAAKLKSLGRNPAMPWKKQSPVIEIDAAKDYISDRGDEVWRILAAKGIDRVILVGVHTNMCVLGRPFGLRQMAKKGKKVVLMRDMTDCMYNPARWPYVDHYTGNDLIISHVERYVCPTITSDQILGGEAFRFKNDMREVRDVMEHRPIKNAEKPVNDWTNVKLAFEHVEVPDHLRKVDDAVWYRCAVKIPADWTNSELFLKFYRRGRVTKVWLNGKELRGKIDEIRGGATWPISPRDVMVDEANLLVVRTVLRREDAGAVEAPVLTSGDKSLRLYGGWQLRVGDDKSWSNIPLPAKFGAAPDWYFEPSP